MKPRIALALECPLMQHGGVETLIRGLLLGLTPHYDITLVSADADRSAIPEPFASLISDQLFCDARSPGSVKTLVEALCRREIELAHFHFGGVYTWNSRLYGRCPVVACVRAGIPTMTTVHLVQPTLEGFCGPAKPLWFKLALFPAAWASRFQVLRSALHEYAVSDHDKRLMQSAFFPMKERIGRIYHSRIDVTAERPLDLDHRDRTVLSVGTIGYRKGQPYLVRAFAKIAARHPDWKLLIVGRGDDGEYGQWFQREIQEAAMGDRLVWAGPLSDPEIVELMYRASLFVMPSLHEGLGLALQEALYRGCPAVGSRAGGIPELIDHESNGLLVPPIDVDALAAAMDRMLSDDGLRRKMAAEARPSIIRKGMTQAGMVETHQAVYDSILKR